MGLIGTVCVTVWWMIVTPTTNFRFLPKTSWGESYLMAWGCKTVKLQKNDVNNEIFQASMAKQGASPKDALLVDRRRLEEDPSSAWVDFEIMFVMLIISVLIHILVHMALKLLWKKLESEKRKRRATTPLRRITIESQTQSYRYGRGIC
jgi:hypothetical protein